MEIALIGFGEAAQAFVEGWGQPAPATIRAFDIKTDAPLLRGAKHADYARYAVKGTETLAEALEGADLVLSLVTADKSLVVAETAAPFLKSDALYCDMNSVAPDTKRAAAEIIGAAEARYIDVAVMAPVRPALNKVSLLVSGPHAAAGAATLKTLFLHPRQIAGGIGAASAIKMIRSVMIKGMEALTAECVLSARVAGVEDEVIASLDASFPGIDWRQQSDRNFERMLTHGLRRAAEMCEVAATVRSLGLPAAMAHATTDWQQRLGDLWLSSPPDGLNAKADAILQAIGSATE